MTRHGASVGLAILAVCAITAGARQQSGAPQQQRPQQPGDVSLTLTGAAGMLPRLAVPDFVSMTSDADTIGSASAIASVLWDDLQYEREFNLVPRDTYATIPAPKTPADPPLARWLELGADGVVIGSVQRTGDRMRVEVRVYQTQSGRPVLSKQYEQAIASGRKFNARLIAHTIADEIFGDIRNLRGVARSKIAFDSDRAAERVAGTVQQRVGKEIYVCDYDGENQVRLTYNKNLNVSPVWSPDGRRLAYMSWAGGNADVLVASVYEASPLQRPAHGTLRVMNGLPAWSPDGRRLALVSNRDGNDEIYVMNADGSDLRRLTRNPAIDSTPTWSPSGAQIAFTSDRTGSPQIYITNADGTGEAQPLTHESYCDRPTWSSGPFNEIAYTSRTAPNVFDIRIIDVATGEIRQLTSGGAHNESPAFAPNGRHIAFASNRSGRYQIYTIARDGRDLRQLTSTGNNYMPNWR